MLRVGGAPELDSDQFRSWDGGLLPNKEKGEYCQKTENPWQCLTNQGYVQQGSETLKMWRKRTGIAKGETEKDPLHNTC